MTKGELFLYKLQELRAKSGAQGDVDNRFDLLHAMGILRGLLIDGDNLLIDVNRDHRIKLKFEISQPPNLIIELLHWNLIPEVNGNPVIINLGNFLSTVPLIVKFKRYSVRDIIVSCSNKFGAVHWKKARSQEEENLYKLLDLLTDEEKSEFATKGNMHPPLLKYCMYSICHVAIKAFEPLEEQIKLST